MNVNGLPSILQVTASAERRGAEVFATDLHAELHARGWPVTTVALVAGDRQPRLALETLGTRALAPSTIASLRHRVRESAAVVAHGSSTLPAAFAATRLTNRPWVYRSIGDPRYWQRHPLARQRVRLQLATASRVVVLWEAAADALAAGGVPRNRLVVIPNGVVAARFPLVDRRSSLAARSVLDPEGLLDGPIAAFVGSISAEKGLDVAIDAVSRLPRVNLLVAGDGPLRPSLTERAERLAPGRVRFIGTTDDPARVMAAADVVVVPSRTEGMAAVLIEAGLSGIPVVATDVGAAREVVLVGRSGILVPPGDAAQMADGIREAIDRHLGGPEARIWCAGRYDLPVVADAWSDLLLNVAGR